MDKQDEFMRAADTAMIAVTHRDGTFTFADLWSAGDVAAASAGEDQSPHVTSRYSYRAADRLLQRLRKAGEIAQTEKRGVWQRIVPEGGEA